MKVAANHNLGNVNPHRQQPQSTRLHHCLETRRDQHSRLQNDLYGTQVVVS